MKIVAFIEPPQGDVIEEILRRCGLWCPAAPRAPPSGDLRMHDADSDWDRDSTSIGHVVSEPAAVANQCRAEIGRGDKDSGAAKSTNTDRFSGRGG